MRQGLGRIAAASFVVFGCGEPALDFQDRRGRVVELQLEPPSDPGRVPLALRGRLLGAPSRGEPWLLRGALSEHHDRAMRRGELSSALVERAVPLRFWREGSDCWVQPLSWLEPGQSYTLALTGYGRVTTLAASEDEQRATRFFPPAGEPPHQSAVWCGARFAQLPETVTLAPGSLTARVTRGVFGAPRPDCLTLVAERPPADPVLAPAHLGGVSLEPTTLVPPHASAAPEAACSAGERVAGACLEVLDDRAFVTPMADSALWLLEAPHSAQLSLPRLERRLLLRDLVPESLLAISGRVVTSGGTGVPLELSLRTQPPRRHLVLSEVLANALGPEPDSEWIEVVNDSERATQLSGVWLEDGGSRVPLPEVRLEPHETVLLVGESFRSSSADVAVTEGARLIRLPALGQRGLSNSGELLQLVGPEGVLSRFPMLPAAHAGVSIARRSLDAADDRANSFAEHGAPGASPGAPNFFD